MPVDSIQDAIIALSKRISNVEVDPVSISTRGAATLLSGTTSLAVNHGLSTTPNVINIMFAEQGTNDYGRWWVDTVGAAQFTLHVSADPGASNLDFWWEARVL